MAEEDNRVSRDAAARVLLCACLGRREGGAERVAGARGLVVWRRRNVPCEMSRSRPREPSKRQETGQGGTFTGLCRGGGAVGLEGGRGNDAGDFPVAARAATAAAPAPALPAATGLLLATSLAIIDDHTVKVSLDLWLPQLEQPACAPGHPARWTGNSVSPTRHPAKG